MGYVGRVGASLVRCRVVIHGEVQGVWFRETTRAEAVAAGLAGWVRNRPDGTVEAVFEGSAAAVDRLVGFCNAGPSGATVERVDVAQEEPKDLTGFEVQ